MRNEKKVMRDYLLKIQGVQAENFGILAIDINAAEDGDAININVFEKDYAKVREKTGDYTIWSYSIYNFWSKKKNDAEFKKFMNCVKKNINKKV